MKKYLTDKEFKLLLLDWDYSKNIELGLDPKKITHGSNKVASWICHVCGSKWENKVSERVRGPKCPFCIGIRVNPETNSILKTHPDISRELVNKDLAKELTAGSSQVVEWLCPNNHEWRTDPYSRTRNNYNCSVCSKKKLVVGVNDLSTTHPELSKKLVDPSESKNYTSGSEKYLKWKCDKEDHFFEKKISAMVRGVSECSVCTNKTVFVGFNDLWTTHSDISRFLKNREDGFKVTYGSHEKLLWVCEKGHEWETNVYNITLSSNWCPNCSKRSVSKPEEKLELLLGEDQVITQHSIDTFRVDLFIPTLNLVIEYDGGYWHRNTYEKDTSKTEKILEKGHKLVRIREEPLEDLPVIDPGLLQIGVKYSKNLNHISEDLIKLIFNHW